MTDDNLTIKPRKPTKTIAANIQHVYLNVYCTVYINKIVYSFIENPEIHSGI